MCASANVLIILGAMNIKIQYVPTYIYFVRICTNTGWNFREYTQQLRSIHSIKLCKQLRKMYKCHFCYGVATSKLHVVQNAHLEKPWYINILNS